MEKNYTFLLWSDDRTIDRISSGGYTIYGKTGLNPLFRCLYLLFTINACQTPMDDIDMHTRVSSGRAHKPGELRVRICSSLI